MTRRTFTEPRPPRIHDPVPMVTALYHLDQHGRVRLFMPEVLVQPTERFTVDGDYIAMVDGAAVLVFCVTLTAGPHAGRVNVLHRNPVRPVGLYDNALALRDILLGRVLQPVYV